MNNKSINRDPYARFRSIPAPTIDELELPIVAKQLTEPRSTLPEGKPNPIRFFNGLILTIGFNREVNKAALVNEYVAVNALRYQESVRIVSCSESSHFNYAHDAYRNIMFTQNPSEHENYYENASNLSRLYADCIVFDEIRSVEEARAAIQLATTGRIVFASISATTSARAIQKIIQLFPSDEREHMQEELARGLKGILNHVRQRWSILNHPQVHAFEILNSDESMQEHIRKGEFSLIDEDIDKGDPDKMLSIKRSFESLLAEWSLNEKHDGGKEVTFEDYVKSLPDGYLPDSAKLLKLHEND